MSWKKAVAETLSQKLSKPVTIQSVNAVGGGSINDAYRIETSASTFFVKKNIASLYPGMFEKEAKGLEILKAANEIEVPEVVALGSQSDVSFLVLNFIRSASKQSGFWEDFGSRLAALHTHSSEQFGLDHDNYIGSLRQSNAFYLTWPDFFREERLEAQVKLARDKGRIGRETVSAFERFYLKIEELFPKEPPALLHGDLWSVILWSTRKAG